METVRDLDLLRGLVGDCQDQLLRFVVRHQDRRALCRAVPAAGGPDGAGRRCRHQLRRPRSLRLTVSSGRLHHFAAWCADENCRLGAQQDDVLSTIKDFLDQLDQQPLAVADGRTLSQQQGVEAVFYRHVRRDEQLAGAAGCARRRRSSTAMAAGCCSWPMPRIGVIAMAAMASSTTPSPRSAVWTARTTASAPRRSGWPRTSRTAPVLGPAEWPRSGLPAVAGQARAQAARRSMRRGAADRGHWYDGRPGHAV